MPRRRRCPDNHRVAGWGVRHRVAIGFILFGLGSGSRSQYGSRSRLRKADQRSPKCPLGGRCRLVEPRRGVGGVATSRCSHPHGVANGGSPSRRRHRWGRRVRRTCRECLRPPTGREVTRGHRQTQLETQRRGEPADLELSNQKTMASTCHATLTNQACDPLQTRVVPARAYLCRAFTIREIRHDETHGGVLLRPGDSCWSCRFPAGSGGGSTGSNFTLWHALP